jgi:hypothetical protein
MTITVTIRPNGARTEVRDLPWEGRGAGYRIVGEAIGASREGQVQHIGGGVFTVSRPHTVGLIGALATRYGRIRVIQYGGQTMCVEACWKSQHPENAWQCSCSCAGANHGSGQPLDLIVDEAGPAGALSVSRSAVREWYHPA